MANAEYFPPCTFLDDCHKIIDNTLEHHSDAMECRGGEGDAQTMAKGRYYLITCKRPHLPTNKERKWYTKRNSTILTMYLVEARKSG
jgi:hypothetical protein